MSQPAIFVDRDNTVIADPGYITDADQVRLLPGSAEAVRRWNQAGYRVVMVTNQSAVARGLITEAQLEEIHAHVEHLLNDEQAELDGIYYCPYLDGPEAIVPQYRRDSDLRKPRPGMLLKAAEELDLDLPGSWMVGDKPTDVQAGLAAGCRTILISRETLPPDDVEADYIVESLTQAAGIVLNGEENAGPLARAAVLAPQEPSQPGPTPEQDTSEISGLLREIRGLLQLQQRQSAQRDFSPARLAATLAQIVAIAVLFWGLSAFVGESPGAAQSALIRFVLAGVIQLIALTLFITDRPS